MTTKEFFCRLRHRLWSTSQTLLLLRPANAPLPEQTWKPCPGEFRDVTEENINDCGQFENAVHYVPIYREMLKQGDVVHFGYLNGKCVFRHCMQRSGSFYEDGCLVHTLGADEAFIHYVFCSPNARGLGFHTEGTRRFCEQLLAHSFYTCVKPDNFPSLHGFFLSGFQPYSLLTVKNRFLFRRLHEHILTPEEIRKYYDI